MKKKLELIKSHNNEKGMALVVVLLVLVVVSVMGLSIMGLAASNMKMSSGDRNYQSSYYIAESGVTYIMNLVNKNALEVYNQTDTDTSAKYFSRVKDKLNNYLIERPLNEIDPAFIFEKTPLGEQPIAKIKIEPLDSNNGKYKIISTGIIDNRLRTVEKIFTLTWKAKNSVVKIPTDKAVFVKNNLNLSGNVEITGSVGTNSSGKNIISLSGFINIHGSLGVNSTNPNNSVTKSGTVNIDNSVVAMTETYNFSMPIWDFPSSPIPAIDLSINSPFTLFMDKNLAYKNFNINNSLEINVGSTDKYLIVNNFNTNSGNITITGSGKLTIYVLGDITINGNSTINKPNNIKNLEFIVKKSNISSSPKEITASGLSKIYGSLFAEDANITLSGNSGFQGNIVTGGTNVTFSGYNETDTRVFYTPNADITLSGNCDIKGSVIAKSLTASGYQKFSIGNLTSDSFSFLNGNGSSGTVSITDLILKDPVREE